MCNVRFYLLLTKYTNMEQKTKFILLQKNVLNKVK